MIPIFHDYASFIIYFCLFELQYLTLLFVVVVDQQ